MRELPRGKVTFLFTDVQGSTRLLDELGAERYAEALAEHRRVLREAFAAHSGVEVDTQGDAFFVAFPTADAALAAAAEAQAALSAPVRVRMGVHTGEPLVVDGGYFGMDVHRGARIAAAGHGGQVVVSETTRAALTGTVPVKDLGEQRLKDLGAPIRLFQLGDEEFPPLKVLYRSTLPVQPNPLVGRERELAEAGALLVAHRLLTLSGPGGSGKTRLALQLAAEAQDDFPDGVYWVPLATLRGSSFERACAYGSKCRNVRRPSRPAKTLRSSHPEGTGTKSSGDASSTLMRRSFLIRESSRSSASCSGMKSTSTSMVLPRQPMRTAVAPPVKYTSPSSEAAVPSARIRRRIRAASASSRTRRHVRSSPGGG
jgi:hypothetical protein